MGKNIFQQLAAYLRDLQGEWDVNPPSGVDPGDRRQPLLTAIEGGKGKGEWDGNERRKHRAVIGIPYSSDTSRLTVEEEEEEIVMKKATKYMFAIGTAVAAAFALSACGGGGGGMSGTTTSAGTTGFTSGVITGFGTLHLGTGQNEKVFDVRNAVMKRVDDNVVDHNANHDAHEDNVVFRLGMRVEIFHDADDNNAVEVRFKNDLEGPITAKPSAVAGATFDVLGVPVNAANANFDDSLGNSGLTLAGLAVGDVIEVSGLFDNNGVLQATFIEGEKTAAQAAGRTFEITGTIDNVTGTAPNQVVTVHGVQFQLDANTNLHDLTSGLAIGMMVEIKTQNPSPFLVTKIEPTAGDFDNPENEIRNAAKASVEGFVTGLTGTTPNFSFTLSGTSVTTSSATVGLGLVSPGAHIEAEGPVAGGVINATKISPRP